MFKKTCSIFLSESQYGKWARNPGHIAHHDNRHVQIDKLYKRSRYFIKGKGETDH